jgi:hypothetical protein
MMRSITICENQLVRDETERKLNRIVHINIQASHKKLTIIPTRSAIKIRGFHPRDRGSTPRVTGRFISYSFFVLLHFLQMKLSYIRYASVTRLSREIDIANSVSMNRGEIR